MSQPRANIRQCGPGGSLVIAMGMLLMLGACQTAPFKTLAPGPDYQPSNVHRSADHLPRDFRRVAVLPITFDENQSDAIAGAQTLEPVVRTEMLKTGQLEWVWVTPEALGRWTGRRRWEADEKLPADFFKRLREELACDGVLFCRLRRFRPYPPLVIGWNFQLIEATRLETLWAIDELFDCGESSVANSARRYEQQHQKGGPVADPPLILTSPVRFGQYTAWAAVSTLPAR
jgi:hypothetical protein